MRTINIKNPKQYKRGLSLTIKTILESGVKVRIGPFDGKFLREFGQLDIIGKQEDKVYEMVKRKLDRSGITLVQ